MVATCRPPLLVLIPTILLIAPPGGAEPSPSTTAFVGATVLTMDRDDPLPDHTVVVRDGVIVAVGPTGRVAVPAGAAVVDGRGRWLLPGLVDSHVHLDSQVQARPELGDGPLFLAYGVTSVVNLRGQPHHLEWRRRQSAGELLGPNLYTSGEFVNEPRVRTAAEVEAEVAAQAAAGYDLIKHHQVVSPEGRYLTTRGLDDAAYRSMNRAARAAGIPLVGHAPLELGLAALLAERQSLAHANELSALHFLPVRGQSAHLGVARWAGLALVLALLAGAGSAVAVRRRRQPAPERSRHLDRAPRLAAAALTLTAACAVLFLLVMPGGAALGSLPLLALLTLAAAALALTAVALAHAALVGWRDDGATWTRRLTAVVATGAAIALAASVTTRWTPVAWRSSAAGMTRTARSCAAAGIWVQTTLVVQETGRSLLRGEGSQLAQQPAYRWLPPAHRAAWTAVPPWGPRWLAVILDRYPAFLQQLVATLHREGVGLIAGTDAYGFPLIVPGASLHRELALLEAAGLSRLEVLRTATVNPAAFLGRAGELGVVAPGARADLVLVPGDPLADLAVLERPEGVMVRGRWLERAALDALLDDLAAETAPAEQPSGPA